MPQVQLSKTVANKLLALDPKIKPNGGFQKLAIELREKLDPTTLILTITATDIEKTRRYYRDYGSGGWQNLYNAILKHTE